MAGQENRLRTHTVHLTDGGLHLRPLTEADWDFLLAWNRDPEVLAWSEGDWVAPRSLEEVQAIYRGVARTAYVFVAEVEGRAVGDAWVQEMNLPRIIARHPSGTDLHRIDIEIGEPVLWGRGLGTRIIRLLRDFAFERLGSEAVYACCISSTNHRSLGAFRRCGFQLADAREMPAGSKAPAEIDMVCLRPPDTSQVES